MVCLIRTENSEIVAEAVYGLSNIITVLSNMFQSLYITRQHRSFSSPSSQFLENAADSGDR